jgi:hypothetical protein
VHVTAATCPHSTRDDALARGAHGWDHDGNGNYTPIRATVPQVLLALGEPAPRQQLGPDNGGKVGVGGTYQGCVVYRDRDTDTTQPTYLAFFFFFKSSYCLPWGTESHVGL